MELQRLRTRAAARRAAEYFEQHRPGLCELQDDLSVANAAGATVRADINNNLQALGTRMSGTSAPSTTYAYMLWVDTTNGVVKRRNAANTGWIIEGTIDEAFVLSRSSNTMLDVSDFGKFIVATSSFTQTLDAAATLGDGWWCVYRNDGTGTITIDPNSSEQINGATTLDLKQGETAIIYCTGAAFKADVAPRVVHGTFTPTISFGGGTTGITYGTQTGVYKRVGNMVWFKIVIILSSKGSSTGSLSVNALPVTSKNDVATPIAVRLGGSLGSIGVCQGYVNANTTTISIEKLSGGSASILVETDVGNTAQIYLSGWYEAA